MNYTAVDQSEDVTKQRIVGNECMVVEDGPDIIGTILFYPPGSLSGSSCFESPGVAAIGQLAVDPERQGEGIGNLLIRAAERRAVEIGATESALDTAESAHHLIAWYIVHAIDDDAVTFYARYGFQVFPAGTRTMFLPI